MTYAAFALAAFQLPFLWNLWCSLRGLTLHLPDGVQDRGQTPILPAGVQRQGLTPHVTSLGLWLFLASEAMFFASLFSAYVMLRTGTTDWPARAMAFPWLETVLLIGASATFGASRFRLIGAHALSLTFVIMKVLGDVELIGQGITPATNLLWACWFTITGVHAAHVLGGAIYTGWLAGPAFGMAEDDRPRFLARVEATRRYWLFVDVVWLFIVIGFI